MLFLSYFLTALFPALSVFLYFKWYKCNNKLSTPVNTTLPKPGISTVDFIIPQESDEEYLKRLKFIHSDAWDYYYRNQKSTKLFDSADLYVNRLITGARERNENVKVGNYVMKFSDDTEIWISNKYYGYGNIHSCKRKELLFESRSHRLSPYTFLSLVDIELEHSDFKRWKKLHDEYSVRTYKKSL